METSDPDIFAVGECVEHRGSLLRPGRAAARAGQGAGGDDHRQQGPDLHRQRCRPRSSRSWASTSSRPATGASTNGAEPVRYEDPALGVYKKLLVRDNRLAGVILVGDASDSHRYMDWLRTDADLDGAAPAPAVSAARRRRRPRRRRDARQRDRLRLRRRHQGRDHPGHPRAGRQHAGAAEGVHARHHRLRQLHSLCQDLLKAVAPEFEEETKKVLCACVPFTQDNCARSCAVQKLKSVQEVLDIYGNGKGCEVCKPALSYMLDMLWCGDHDEDRSARFINDRVHANIQKDGTFSVVPRMRGGVTTPAELRRIADVADKYHVPMVKITGSQRIDLLGVKKADLPKIWADLGHAVGPGVHQGRAHGEDLRRHRVLPLRHAGLDHRRHRDGAAPRESVHAAQGQDGRGRLSAQLRRGHGQGHRPGRAGRRLAGGGRRRRGQGGAQGRPADHRRDHGAGARGRRSSSSSTTARTPTIWSAPTTSSSASASRRCARKPSTHARSARSRCSTGCANPRASPTTRGWNASARVPRSSSKFNRSETYPNELDSHHCRREHSAARRPRRAVGRPSLAIFNIGDRFLAVENRCPHGGGPLADGIVGGATVTCPLHNWRICLEAAQVYAPVRVRLHMSGSNVSNEGRGRHRDAVLAQATAAA